MYGHNNTFPQYRNEAAQYPGAFTDQSWQHMHNYDQMKNQLNQSLVEAWNLRQQNTEFINNFINDNCQNSLTIKKKNNTKKRLGIADTKALIITIKKLNLQLNDNTEKLKLNNSTDEKWLNDFNNCQQLKNNIELLLNKLTDNEKICSFKKLLEQRKNKRLREKKLREKLKKKKDINNEIKLRLNEKADNWIREKQDEINREKQNELLKKEADIVLSEVRGKRGDAKKYLGILRELKNLRKVMVANARARGEKQSAAADQTFENIIEQLSKHWTQLEREYSIEEQGLKLMLQTDNEKIIAKQKKNTFDDWEIALFGKPLPLPENVEKNLNNIFMTRCAWDKFIYNDNDSSRIPLGWIMPDPPTSAAWQKCLKKN